MNETNECLVCFADDISTLVRAPTWSVAKERIETLSATLFERMKKCASVRAHPAKTEVLTFGKGVKIAKVDCVKF